MTAKLFIIIAVVIFVLAAFGVRFEKLDLVPLGLAIYCGHKLV